MEIRTTPHYFELIFPYRPSIVEAIKKTFVEGQEKHYRFNPDSKTWRVLISERRKMEVFAHRYGFTFSSVTNKVVNEDYTIPPMPKLDFDIPLNGTMREYQKEGVAYNLLHKRVIIGDDMGCISGDAIINFNIKGASKKLTLEKLYEKYTKSSIKESFKVRCLKDGEFGLHKMNNIIDKGYHSCLTITTKSGKSLTLTFDHEVLTPHNGYIRADKLKIGDYIIINGVLKCKECGSSEGVITYKYSKFLGICKKCMYSSKRVNGRYKTGSFIDKDGYVRLSGYQNHPRSWSGGLVYEHLIVMEKHLGYVVPKNMDVHHKNRNKSDNRIENLELITVSEHNIEHKRHRNFGLYITPKEDEITEIVYCGLKKVYDIVMDDPYRNFVANGIVVHNCGKTLQAIASIVGGDILYQRTGENPVYPCLVICPSSVKYNWQDQWQKWTGRNITMILNDSVKRNWWLYYEANMCKVFIVNYESLKKYFVEEIEVHYDKVTGKKLPLRLDYIKFKKQILLFNSIVVDESHRIKDSGTIQSKLTQGIARAKKWILLLTGTPVVNKPKDLIQQLTTMGVMNYFGEYRKFTQEFCSGEREASNLKKLNYVLNKYCFYRRSKQEVAKELPPKSRQVVLCDITNRKEYEAAQNDLINYLTQYKDATDEKIQSALRGEVMVKIGILKNISARGKMADVVEYIDDVIEDGEKLGIFVHLKEIGYELLKRYKNSAVITGDIDLKERQNMIRKFKEDPKCTTAILSIMAAGTGVDGLQHAASTACFIEQPWTASACDQAEDRFNRIGQTKPVTIIYFLGRDTIDQHIYNIIQTKRDIADAITGNTDEVKIDFVNEFANLLTKK
jgi:SWI/SNF-related matrix-associated actin-dependent regulator 1 of chromatin subfamily A